jgi:hypothetical protein
MGVANEMGDPHSVLNTASSMRDGSILEQPRLIDAVVGSMRCLVRSARMRRNLKGSFLHRIGGLLHKCRRKCGVRARLALPTVTVWAG